MKAIEFGFIMISQENSMVFGFPKFFFTSNWVNVSLFIGTLALYLLLSLSLSLSVSLFIGTLALYLLLSLSLPLSLSRQIIKYFFFFFLLFIHLQLLYL